MDILFISLGYNFMRRYALYVEKVDSSAQFM
jgi:hypothetical protein